MGSPRGLAECLQVHAERESFLTITSSCSLTPQEHLHDTPACQGRLPGGPRQEAGQVGVIHACRCVRLLCVCAVACVCICFVCVNACVCVCQQGCVDAIHAITRPLHQLRVHWCAGDDLAQMGALKKGAAAAEEFLLENPELKSVHSAASVKTLMDKAAAAEAQQKAS